MPSKSSCMTHDEMNKQYMLRRTSERYQLAIFLLVAIHLAALILSCFLYASHKNSSRPSSSNPACSLFGLFISIDLFTHPFEALSLAHRRHPFVCGYLVAQSSTINSPRRLQIDRDEQGFGLLLHCSSFRRPCYVFTLTLTLPLVPCFLIYCAYEMEKQQSTQRLERHLYTFLLISAILSVGLPLASSPSQSLNIIDSLL